MALGNARTDKVKRLGDLSGGMRKRLIAAKVSCVVLGMIAIVGLCGVMKQPSIASAFGSPRKSVQVAQLLKSREKEFLDRMCSLSERLEKIKAEVLEEIGEEEYWEMLGIMDDLIAEDDWENFNRRMNEII